MKTYALSRTGSRFLALGHYDETVRLYDTVTRTEIASMRHCADISPKDRNAASDLHIYVEQNFYEGAFSKQERQTSKFVMSEAPFKIGESDSVLSNITNANDVAAKHSTAVAGEPS